MKYVLIIGANNELGGELAKIYAKNSYNLYLTGRSIIEMQDDADYLENTYNIKVKLCTLDLTNFNTHQKFYNDMAIKPAGIIYVAGYYPDPSKACIDWSESANTINVNYTGAVSLLNIISRDFSKYKSGFIVGISSVSGLRGRAKNYIYGSSKAAFIAYLSGLRNMLNKSKVDVLTVISGYICTKKSSKEESPKILVISPKELAAKIYNAQQRKKDIIYSSYIWKLIMLFIRLLPESLFKKLKI